LGGVVREGFAIDSEVSHPAAREICALEHVFIERFIARIEQRS
jgi:hypothetical protein